MKYEGVIRKSFEVKSTSGQEFLCLCPWHADTGGGHLYVNAIKGVYLCMSCGTKGHLDRMGLVPRMTTADIRERLAMVKAPKVEFKTYPEGWLKKFAVPHPFWTQERGLPQDVVDLFCLGYDPFTNRMTLPLRDVHGRILGVSYRRIDGGSPKYLNPKGYPIGRHLYGAWLLTDKPVRTVAVTEGQVDAIRCWSYGIPAVAAMGARLTDDQVRVLQRLGVHKVVLLLDNDNAGRKGTIAIYDALRGTGIRVVSGWYRPYWTKPTPDGLREVKDPDELSRPRLRKMYHSAVGILDWIERTGYGG